MCVGEPPFSDQSIECQIPRQPAHANQPFHRGFVAVPVKMAILPRDGHHVQVDIASQSLVEPHLVVTRLLSAFERAEVKKLESNGFL